MREVVGYSLEVIDLQSVSIPIASDLLSVSYEHFKRHPTLWVRQDAEITVNTPHRNVCIYMVVPGGLIAPGSHFLGTTTLPSGAAIMHWFEGAK